MIPGVCGFAWSAGDLIFLGIFYCVILSVLCTVAVAARRTILDVSGARSEDICWHEEFGDLPAAARACRHQLTGEVKHRICENGFECGTCALHPKFLRKSAAEGSASPVLPVPASILGFDAPADRLYHRGHNWVRLETDGTATVGLDDFGSRVLGKTDHAVFPKVGTVLRLNGTGFRLTRAGSAIRVLSPLEGKLIATGGPQQGWYLRLKPLRGEFELDHLLRGPEVQSWILRESERLQLALAMEGIGLSLADGGEMVKDVPGAYPGADWDAIWGDIFLEP